MEQQKAVKPHLVIMVGIPGSGKNYFAENFAKSFNSHIVSSTLIRNNLFDKPTFEPAEDYIVDKVANYLLDELLKTNKTIILKSKADNRAERSAIYKKCKDFGYEPLLVWVQTDIDTAKSRFLKQMKGNLNAEQMFDQRVKRFVQPTNSEKSIVISGKFTYQSQQKIVLKRLAGPCQPTIEHKTIIRAPISQRYLIR